ncbi:MAG: hypothetical protein GXX09_10905 [Syntrophomonadaceae bacterium]|nr:hypothetical protein [Syntrophomonadaceae bacterium]
MKLRIKFCGGCNPIINRSKLVKAIKDELGRAVNFEIVEQQADVGLIVGGCPVCCVNLSQIEDQARHWVVVGGYLLDHKQIPVDQLPQKVTEKLLEKGGDKSC